MINFYYKTIADIFCFDILPHFQIEDVVYLAKTLYNIHFESDGSKMENWFSDILEYSSLLRRDLIFQKFYDGGFSSYSGFRIKIYKKESKELYEDIEDWKERGMAVFKLQEADGEIDIIICNGDNSQQLTKIVNIVKILSDGIVELDFKRL
mgnify:CR=1 FL=1